MIIFGFSHLLIPATRKNKKTPILFQKIVWTPLLIEYLFLSSSYILFITNPKLGQLSKKTGIELVDAHLLSKTCFATYLWKELWAKKFNMSSRLFFIKPLSRFLFGSWSTILLHWFWICAWLKSRFSPSLQINLKCCWLINVFLISAYDEVMITRISQIIIKSLRLTWFLQLPFLLKNSQPACLIDGEVGDKELIKQKQIWFFWVVQFFDVWNELGKKRLQASGGFDFIVPISCVWV